jgi:hypothetical protein
MPFSVSSVHLWSTAFGPSRAAESYAATVAALTSDHGPFWACVLAQRRASYAVLPASALGKVVCGLPREPTEGNSYPPIPLARPC